MSSIFHAVGVDLAWGDNPTGVAHLAAAGGSGEVEGWRLLESRTFAGPDAVAAWIQSRVPTDAAACVAVDAPLLATNPEGTQRAADNLLSAEFRRFRVMALPVDGRHTERGARLLAALARQGFAYAPPGQAARAVIETFPTAAQLSLFDLRKPLPYKRGPVEHRKGALRDLAFKLATLDDRALPLEPTSALNELLRTDALALQGAKLKALEDRLDAFLCALVAALTRTAPGRLKTYGTAEAGFITVPHPPVVA